MSIDNNRMKEQTVIHLYKWNIIQQCKWTTTPVTTWMSLTNIMLSKGSPTQEYHFVHVKLKCQKYSMMINSKTVVIFREGEVTERDNKGTAGKIFMILSWFYESCKNFINSLICPHMNFFIFPNVLHIAQWKISLLYTKENLLLSHEEHWRVLSQKRALKSSPRRALYHSELWDVVLCISLLDDHSTLQPLWEGRHHHLRDAWALAERSGRQWGGN